MDWESIRKDMVTYIIYEESEKYPLSSLLPLSWSFRNMETVCLIKKPENPADLPDYIDAGLPEQNVSEWRVLFLDCSKVYQVENPYKEYQRQFEYIDEFLKQGSLCSITERRVTRFLPEQIYCVAMRCGLYFHTEEEGYLYSDFAKGHSSRFRYFIYDVGEIEPILPEPILFQVLCSAIILALNEWQNTMLEKGYLYQCILTIEKEKVSEYIGEMEGTRRYIENMLLQEKQRMGCEKEYISEIRDFSEKQEITGNRERTILFGKKWFPFAVEDNVTWLYQWRMEHMDAIQCLEEWKQGIVLEEKKDWDIAQQVSLHGMENLQRKYLSKSGWKDLTEKKRACAEEIFKDIVMDKECKNYIGQSELLLQQMEQKLQTRMTKKCVKVWGKECLIGFACVVAFGLLILADSQWNKEKIWLWAFIIGILIFAFVGECLYFYWERMHIRKKLNKSLKVLDSSFSKSEKWHNRLQAKILEHKEYSLIEHWQNTLLQREQKEQGLLEAYSQMLLSSEGTIQQLLWIFGEQPKHRDISSQIAVDFSVPPQGPLDCYMPHYRHTYPLSIKGMGIDIEASFPFISGFYLKKVYLPYIEEQPGEKSNENKMEE